MDLLKKFGLATRFVAGKMGFQSVQKYWPAREVVPTTKIHYFTIHDVP